MAVLLIAFSACRVMHEGVNPAFGCANEPFIDNHPASTQMDSVIEAAVNDGLVGGTIWVHSATKGSYSRGFGFANLQTQQVTDRCQQFRVASLTKMFTATLILMLIEEGQITLDTKVGEFLDESQVSGIQDINLITIEELLNHTSGIPNYDDDVRFAPMLLNDPGRLISLEQKLNLVRNKGGRVPKWVIKKFGQIYSNTNYLLLHLIIEKATGQDYDTVLAERILQPLKLYSTVTSRENPFPSRLANAYVDFYGDGKMREVREWDAYRFDGEGSIISTVNDLHTFFDALLSGQLISLPMLEQMKDKRLGLLQEAFELENAMGHDGIAIGYSAEMWYLPRSQLMVILLSNQGRLVNENWSVLKYENLLRRVIEVAR